jgi:CRP-like cAMP-binding protein
MPQTARFAPGVGPRAQAPVPSDGCRCGCLDPCPLASLDRTLLAGASSQAHAAVTWQIPAGALVNLAPHQRCRLLTLRHGILKVGCADPDGHSAIGGLRYPGDPVESYASLAGCEMFLEAVVPSAICALDLRRLDGAPDVATRILVRRLEQTQTLLVAAERRYVSLLSKPPDARIAWFVLELAERPEHRPGWAGGNGSEVVDLILRRRDIAECLGLAAETVSRVLTRLQQAGILKKLSRGRLQIVDRSALTALGANSGRLS